MKVCEIFESIQGEGKYVGQPALFIRLSGCTRDCSFCDTKYHKIYEDITNEQLAEKINQSKLNHVIWTGGEPILQQEDIYKVIRETSHSYQHLETNGDILPQILQAFDYICFSPKEKKIALKLISHLEAEAFYNYDIKVVTDTKLNVDIIPYATMLMPLTTGDEKRDLQIKQDVWNFCVQQGINYTPRIHRDVWGNKKRI